MVCILRVSCVSTEICEHGRLTLAKKLDAVHKNTVTRRRLIPSVRRATPSKDGLTGMLGPERVSFELGEDVDLLSSSGPMGSPSKAGTAARSAAAGGTGVTVALIATERLRRLPRSRPVKGSALGCKTRFISAPH